MARLKSYSCPTCGSFLEVDRDRDVFDCPFCGSHFDAVSFHGKELNEQARTLLKNKNYSLAREKYELLLKHRPDDFEMLCGYACAVGEVQSLDDFAFPDTYSMSLLELFNNDPRYQQGASAPYFAKLSEMFELSRKYSEALLKLHKYQQKNKKPVRMFFDDEDYGFRLTDGNIVLICVIVCMVVWFTIMGIVIAKLDYTGNVFALFTCLIVIFPISIIIAFNIRNARLERLKAAETSVEAAPVPVVKTEEELLNEELQSLWNSGKNAYSFIPELKRRAGSSVPVTIKDNAPKAAVPSIISKNSFLIKHETVDDDDIEELFRSAKCSKCGAVLALDREQKLFVCDHCGVTYDYALFIGAPLAKAAADLKNREFKLADKRYSRILEDVPDDFEANRGRILCACRWIGFNEAKIESGYGSVDWEALDRVLAAAIDNSEDKKAQYFIDLKDILKIGRTYYDKGEKIKELKKESFVRVEVAVYTEQREELYEEYYEKFRGFLIKDRKLRGVAYSIKRKPDASPFS